MSSLHLAKGSALPPKKSNILRLYSMVFCPYAQRVRLVLAAKEIQYETVNIHLKNKPEWFSDINSEGKVPVLDTGSEIITESLVISDYLDEKYPTPPLHPSSPELKQKHKNLVEIVGNLTKVYHNFVWGKEEMNLIDKFEELKPQVEQLENELEKQGTYFGGNNPGMLDYMTWPWAERLPIVKLLYTGELPTTTDSFPRLKLWYNNMLTQKPVQQTVFKPEAHYKLMQLYRKDEPVDYDQLFAAATSK